jgi:hypothetical protein
MRCDACSATATRTCLNVKTGQVRILCKADSKRLPDSDTTRKYLKPVWLVTRLQHEAAKLKRKRANV